MPLFLPSACSDKGKPQTWSSLATNTGMRTAGALPAPTPVLPAVLFPFKVVPLKKWREPERNTQVNLFLSMRFCCFLLYLLELNVPAKQYYSFWKKKNQKNERNTLVFSFVTIWHLKIVKASSSYVHILLYIKTPKIILQIISGYFKSFWMQHSDCLNDREWNTL